MLVTTIKTLRKEIYGQYISCISEMSVAGEGDDVHVGMT